MSAIGNDAAFLDDGDMDAVDAFFAKLAPDADKKEQPSVKAEPQREEPKQPVREPEPKEPEPTSEPEEDPEAPTDAEPAETIEGEPSDKEPTYADDETYVKVPVNGEEHEVPVKELARLYGQEQALTQKSMQVAEQRKAVDAELAKNVAATNSLLQRAQKRFEPYSKIDFNIAAQELSREEYTALRQAAQSAWEDVQFLQNNLGQSMQAAQQRQQDYLVEQAKHALGVLSGPVDQGGIEGWNEAYYDGLRSFAVEAGLSKDIVDNLVDPAAIRLLNDAYLYQKGKSKVVVTRKVNKTPKQVIKTTRPRDVNAPDTSKINAAAKRAAQSGTTDDAANLFLARWAAHDAEAA